MYRLVIADDEELVRNGLVRHIDWERLGFEVTAQFEDGRYVIEYLKENSVDVVFTDVQMYRVSGLEVAKWIAANRPGIKVVILSGYKEFDYVREALEARVCDYVLKPIESDRIEKIFAKIKEELNRRNSTYYKEITENMQRLVSVITLGQEEAFPDCFEKWAESVQMAAEENAHLLIYQMLERLYEKMEGIILSEGLHKEETYCQINTWTEKDVFAKIKAILQRMVKHVRSQKVLDSESLAARAKEYIERHISEDFSLDDVISSMYVSRSLFAKEFKKQTGESFMNYVIRRRMETAMELIKKGESSSSRLARAVGYAEREYFQKSFKKYTGYTVKEYQRLFQNEK